MTFHPQRHCTVFALALLAMSHAACKKTSRDDNPVFTEPQLAALRANTCLTPGADEPYAFSALPDGALSDRATGAKNKFWAPGQTLRVRFLNGSAALQNKVFFLAEQWERCANIDFVRVDTDPAEVRIAFDPEGHYSWVGKDILNIPAGQKTMNLEFTEASPDTLLRRVTLHEFGHTLGLNHEHQHPLANIPWDTAAVYAYYVTLGWSKEKTDLNVLNKLSWEYSQHTAYDSLSIMEYPVPASLTTNGYAIGFNNRLSTLDKDFIGRMYSPQRIRVRHNVNITSNITFWLNGLYHTLKPGESLWAPAKLSGNQLYIWECPAGACAWDGYAPAYGGNYKIVAQGSNGNLTLAND